MECQQLNGTARKAGARSAYEGAVPEAISQRSRGAAGKQKQQTQQGGTSLALAPPPEPSLLSSAAEPPWWQNQVRALYLVGQASSVLALSLGAAFWVRWIVLELRRKQAAAAQTGAETKGDPAPSDAGSAPFRPAVASSELGGTLLPGASRPVDAVDVFGDPFAPIRALMMGGAATRALGGAQQQQQDAPAPAGPPLPPARLDPNWWQTLSRIHYINFGAQYGILPRITLAPPSTEAQGDGGLLAALAGTGRGQAASCLVAFEDAADAEFVAATLRSNLEAVLEREADVRSDRGAGPAGPARAPAHQRPLRPSVLAGSPLFLDDLARLQGTRLGVIPQGVLSRTARLSDPALQELLAGIITGRAAALGPPLDAAPSGSAFGESAQPGPGTAAAAGPPMSNTARIRVPGVEDFPGTEGGGGPVGSGGAGGAARDGPALGAFYDSLKDLPGAMPEGSALRGAQASPSISSADFKFEFSGFKAPKSVKKGERQKPGGVVSVSRPGVPGSSSGSSNTAASAPQPISPVTDPAPSVIPLEDPAPDASSEEGLPGPGPGSSAADPLASSVSHKGSQAESLIEEQTEEQKLLKLLDKMDEQVSNTCEGQNHAKYTLHPLSDCAPSLHHHSYRTVSRGDSRRRSRPSVGRPPRARPAPLPLPPAGGRWAPLSASWRASRPLMPSLTALWARWWGRAGSRRLTRRGQPRRPPRAKQGRPHSTRCRRTRRRGCCRNGMHWLRQSSQKLPPSRQRREPLL